MKVGSMSFYLNVERILEIISEIPHTAKFPAPILLKL